MRDIETKWSSWLLSGGSINYYLKGSELDKQLVDAFFEMDKNRIDELIDKGANPNAILTIEKKEDGEITRRETGTLLMHLIQQGPIKAIYPQRKPIALSGDPEKRRDQQIQEERRRRVQIQRANEKAKIENQQRKDTIIDMVDFMLDRGARICENVGRCDLSQNGLDKIGFDEVRDYLKLAHQTDMAIEEEMEKQGFNELEHPNYHEVFLKATTEMRNQIYNQAQAGSQGGNER